MQNGIYLTSVLLAVASPVLSQYNPAPEYSSLAPAPTPEAYIPSPPPLAYAANSPSAYTVAPPPAYSAPPPAYSAPPVMPSYTTKVLTSALTVTSYLTVTSPAPYGTGDIIGLIEGLHQCSQTIIFECLQSSKCNPTDFPCICTELKAHSIETKIAAACTPDDSAQYLKFQADVCNNIKPTPKPKPMPSSAYPVYVTSSGAVPKYSNTPVKNGTYSAKPAPPPYPPASYPSGVPAPPASYPAGKPPAGSPPAGKPPASYPAGTPPAGTPPAGKPPASYPAGTPPAGAPPAGAPPAGAPPAGAPPAGAPPAGAPPAGAPPAGAPPAGSPASKSTVVATTSSAKSTGPVVAQYTGAAAVLNIQNAMLAGGAGLMGLIFAGL